MSDKYCPTGKRHTNQNRGNNWTAYDNGYAAGRAYQSGIDICKIAGAINNWPHVEAIALAALREAAPKDEK